MQRFSVLTFFVQIKSILKCAQQICLILLTNKADRTLLHSNIRNATQYEQETKQQHVKKVFRFVFNKEFLPLIAAWSCH